MTRKHVDLGYFLENRPGGALACTRLAELSNNFVELGNHFLALGRLIEQEIGRAHV